MSQLSLNAQNLVNTLSQLTGTTRQASTGTATQALPVQIAFGGNQQITVQNARTLQSATVTRQALQGEVRPGAQYQAHIQQTAQATTLNLFSQGDNPAPLNLKLSQQQFEQILKLPASQILASGQKAIEVKGKITEVGTRQLQVILEGSKQALTLPLPSTISARRFSEGQALVISLQPTGSQWHLQIKAQAQSPALSVLDPANKPQHLQVVSQILASAGKPVALSQNLQPALANWLGVKIVPSPENALLNVAPGGKAELHLKGERPVATVNLDQNGLSLLTKGQTQAPGTIVQSPAQTAQRAPVDIASPSATLQNKANPSTPTSAIANPLTLNTREVKAAIQALQRLTLPNTQSPSQTLQHVINVLSESQNIKSPELKSVLTNIIKVIRGENPGLTVPPVANAVEKVARETVSSAQSPKALLNTNIEPQGVSTAKTEAAASPALSQPENLRQLLTFTPLAVTPVSLTPSTAQPGILGGLVTLLQLTLASRISRPSAAVLEQTQQLLVSLFPSAAPKPSQRAGRPLSDLAQLEQKHGLIKEIGRMLATHQHNKLANAEAALQNQETFYYVLPNLFSAQQQDIELLIRREKPDQQNDKNKAKSGTCWHLTMKLDVGETGQLLSKAKLLGENLEVDFYTSNDDTLVLVRTYLPLLKRRLDSLGITVDKAQSQLGKIPESLQQRPYHIFETKA